MNEISEGRYASKQAAVSPQQPWKTFISVLILPQASSPRVSHCQSTRLFHRNWRYDSQEEGSSCEETCSNYNDVPFSTNKRLKFNGCNKRRPSFSDTELVLDIFKMPVGTTNPTLKSSFSLTSLRSFTPMDSPDHGTPLRLKNERLYHSLTKKCRKSNEQDKELWRKSWGSGISQDGKEFWEGFQADYDYLMAQNILEKTASEISVEKASLLPPTAPPVWSHSEFMDHFAQLYSWLKGIQDLVYGKQENVTDWKLRAERQDDMQRQRFRLDTFNEQSKKLINRYPELESEVSWLTKHINDKWETVECMMGVSKKGEGEKRCELGSQEKVEHEVKCLRRWLRELDTKLKPLSFQYGWTKAELEMKTKEHMVLHRDIEAHRKIVSSVFKLCEKADASTLIAARALERKYHEYYLRSLEWQYHIESLAGLQVNKSPPSWSNDSDGEPVAKIARFNYKDSDWKESDDSEILTKEDESLKEIELAMDVASSETGMGEHFGTTANFAGDRNDESILGMEDSSSTGSTFGTKSRNFHFFSGAKREEDSRPNFATGILKVLPSFAPSQVPNELSDKDLAEPRNTSTPVEFNRPKTRPPNTGMFSWKHADTDSDQEKVKMSERESKEGKMSKEEVDGKDEETTSSEESWTYAPGTENEKLETGVKRKTSAAIRLDFGEANVRKNSNASPKEMRYFSAKNIPKSNPIKIVANKEPISSINRKLVDRAEELFRCKPKSYRAKNAIMRMAALDGEEDKPLDSCDASGEYTEDSDERDSQSSEDNDGSVATCRRSESADGILDETPVGKTLMDYFVRGQRSTMRNRPWSMSNVSLLRNSRGPSLKTRSSMSESALNQVLGQFDKSRDFSLTLRSARMICTEDGTLGSYGSSRRRRTKIRKRMNKRSNSGSDGITLSGSDSPSLSSPGKQLSNISGIVKSGSFSGIIRKQRDFSPTFTKCESGSGTETDDETTNQSPPRFRLGPKAGAVTITSGEKIQVEEQLSLNSVQACWDNYQEKYQSEAYSEEPADSDTAKNLLEFGEDYAKFLGNQSNCASSWNRYMKSRNRNKFDSDSDVDEVKRFLRQSVDQLDLVEMKLNENNGGLVSTNNANDEDSVSKNFLDEIIATCRRNVDCLTKLLNEVGDEIHIPKEQNYIQNVKDSWEDLKTTAELHKAKQLKSDMTALKNELLNWAATIEAMEPTVTSREELEAKIIQIKNELHAMEKGKSKLLQANVSVHRFLSTAKHAEPTLRDEVTELYRVRDQVFCRVSAQLFNLQSLSQAWHDFDDHLSQLQCALRTDTLRVIDFALQCGTPSTDVTGSLRDIAGLLSEKAPTAKDSNSTAEKSNAGINARPLLSALSTEGSLSDSGISDSGSEQELSEREKRLAQLKRLAKRLESILAPSSQALSNMFKRIEEAESGLRELQKTCRDLIVRSSSSEEFKKIVSKTANFGSLDSALEGYSAPKSSCTKRTRSSKEVDKTGEATKDVNEVDGENKKDEKSRKKSWLWRLFRFALPLQLALVALLCVACLMEPRCCDSLNNLEMSLSPRLRYESGPPPV